MSLILLKTATAAAELTFIEFAVLMFITTKIRSLLYELIRPH